MQDIIREYADQYLTCLAGEIEWVCIHKSISQEEASLNMGRSKQYINNVVNRRFDITLDNLLRFCYCTAYDPTELFKSARNNLDRSVLIRLNDFKVDVVKREQRKCYEALELQRKERLIDKIRREQDHNHRICLNVSLEIFNLRLAAGLACGDLGAFLDLTPDAVRDYEKGKTLISIRNLICLCQFYDIYPDAFLNKIHGWEYYKMSSAYMLYMKQKAEKKKNLNYYRYAKFINGDDLSDDK